MRHFKLIARLLLCMFLIAGIAAPSFSQRQRASEPKKITANTKITPTVLTTAKLYMVIGYLETKPNYKQGMSEEEFMKSLFTGFQGQAEPALRKYFKVVYGYHKQNMTPHNVFLKADEKAFIAMYNDLAPLYKPKMTQAEFERVLGVESFDQTAKTRESEPWWVDFLQKVAIIIIIILLG